MATSLSQKELNQAHHEAQASRDRVANAFNLLGDQIEAKVAQAQGLLYRVRTPGRLARQYPYGNVALFLIAGFLIGARLGKPRHSIRQDRKASGADGSLNESMVTEGWAAYID